MRTSTIGQEKLQRIQLIARVQIAQEAAKDAMRRYGGDGSSRAFALVTGAKARLGGSTAPWRW